MSVAWISNGQTAYLLWHWDHKPNKGNICIFFFTKFHTCKTENFVLFSSLTPFRTRTVYFHALASTKEFSVPNFVLQNETRALSADSYHDYSLVGDRGPNGQSTAEFLYEKTNTLVYSQINKDGIACWNITKPYTPDTQGIIDSDSDALVFPNDLKIDRNGNLWVLSDRLPTFIYKQLNPNEFNYRILTGKVSDLILGTPCE